MSSIGKCTKCTKTVYQLEGLIVSKKPYHRSCFKCSVCNWQLTLLNYKDYDGKVYCPNHYPVTGFGVDSHVTGNQGVVHH